MFKKIDFGDVLDEKLESLLVKKTLDDSCFSASIRVCIVSQKGFVSANYHWHYRVDKGCI